MLPTGSCSETTGGTTGPHATHGLLLSPRLQLHLIHTSLVGLAALAWQLLLLLPLVPTSSTWKLRLIHTSLAGLA